MLVTVVLVLGAVVNAKQRIKLLERRRRHARESRGRETTRTYDTPAGPVSVTHMAGPKPKQEERKP